LAAGRQKTKRKNAKRKPRKQAKSKPRKREAQPRKPGRPKKFLDLEEAVRLAALGMPQAAVANTLGVSTSTLARAKADSPAFAEAYDKAVREGTGAWEIEVSKSMLSAIKNGHTGPLLAAWETMQKKYGERPGENPLLMDIPLPDGSTLWCSPGVDPIEAIKNHDNVQKVPSKRS
jgi:hypothetical protein